MKCPVDQIDLVMSDRQGIEIDYCPQCRGVWLDRGELDKMIERSAMAPGAAPHRAENTESSYREPRQYERSRDERYDDDDRHHEGHKKHKKEGFLGDLFDF